jgi:prophage tail gpP-like protein
MKSYTVIAGDTFVSIARKEYGTEVQASLIQRANPGVMEPLTAGISLVVPVLPNAPAIIPQGALFETESEVAFFVGGQRFRFWETMTISRSMDSMDTLELTSPLDSKNAEFKEIFRPFSYKPMTVTVGGVPLFTGILLTPLPDVTDKKKSVNVTGYSLPGVLNDCTVPPSAFPLTEFNNQSLATIAKTMAEPFGLAVEFTEDPGPVFERVATKPTKKVLEFLAELARKRNLIVSSTPAGKLLFQRAVDVGRPIARLVQGEPPLTKVTPSFKAQEYYSHVTGLQPEDPVSKGSQFTTKNSRLEGVLRPFTFQAEDTDNANVKATVDAKAARMFANVAMYSITVSTWRDSFGNLWAPNTTITLFAEDAMIYSEYEFLVKSVALARDGDSESATLSLVIPEAFKGQIPERLPWEE